MPVDELIDDPDMDRALRALQPQMARSRTWAKARRGELLAFIETGQVSQPASLRRLHPDDIAVSDATGERRDSRRLIWLASAAVLALLVAGLVILPRWRDAEPSEPGVVDQPSTTPMPSSTQVIGAGEVDPSLRPELYPVFAVGDPRNDTARGSYSQVGYENAQWAQALVARSDGDVFVDAVGIMVWADIGDVDVAALGTHTTQTLANGRDVDVYTEPGTPPTITVLLPDGPVAVTGIDPLPFVDAIGDLRLLELAIGPTDDASAVVDFTLHELPPGYVTIVEPHPLPRGSLNASLVSGDESANDFIAVEVGLDSPLSGWSVTGPLRPTDVNGTRAWIRDQTLNPISWQIGERTWVTVYGAPTADAALDAARSVEFVDEATWQDRYGVAEPTFAAPPTNATATESEFPSPSVEPNDTIVSSSGFTAPSRGTRLDPRMQAPTSTASCRSRSGTRHWCGTS